jgi:tetratricopeptide (TPR) repeat protein
LIPKRKVNKSGGRDSQRTYSAAAKIKILKKYFLGKMNILMDLEYQRKLLDREITFFHWKQARQRISRSISEARRRKEKFYVYYFLGQNCLLRQRFLRALIYLNYCLKLRNDDVYCWNDKALCFAELGEYGKAIACFDAGIQYNKDSALLYHNKGWLLNRLGRYHDSIVYFRKALELESARVEAVYSLADTYDNLGDDKNAIKYFARALRMLKGKSTLMYKDTLGRIKMINNR